jgi:hypothetical protein
MMASMDFTSSGLGAGTLAKGSGAACAEEAFCDAGFSGDCAEANCESCGERKDGEFHKRCSIWFGRARCDSSFGRANYISGKQWRGENPRGFGRLAAEAGEEPEEKRKSGAENEASDDGEIEGGVFAAVDDVAGKFPEAEGEFGAEVKQGAEDDEDEAEQEKGAAEIAKRVHGNIIGEGARGSQPDAQVKMSGPCHRTITATGCVESLLHTIY